MSDEFRMTYAMCKQFLDSVLKPDLKCFHFKLCQLANISSKSSLIDT